MAEGPSYNLHKRKKMKKNITSWLFILTINESSSETIHTKMCSQRIDRGFFFIITKQTSEKTVQGYFKRPLVTWNCTFLTKFFKLDTRTRVLILPHNCYQVGKKVSQIIFNSCEESKCVCSGSFWLVPFVIVSSQGLVPVNLSLSFAQGLGVEIHEKVMWFRGSSSLARYHGRKSLSSTEYCGRKWMWIDRKRTTSVSDHWRS